VTEPEGEDQFEGAAGGGAAKAAPAEVEEAAEPADSAEPEPSEVEEPAAEDGEAVDVAAVMGAVLDEAAAQQPEPSASDADDEVLVDSTLPDLADDAILHAALESLLLVVDSPAEDELLASTLELPVKRIREAMQALSARYTESGSGIDLRRVGDGWRLHTRDVYAPYVEKLLLDGQRAKLTRAALETPWCTTPRPTWSGSALLGSASTCGRPTWACSGTRCCRRPPSCCCRRSDLRTWCIPLSHPSIRSTTTRQVSFPAVSPGSRSAGSPSNGPAGLSPSPRCRPEPPVRTTRATWSVWSAGCARPASLNAAMCA